MEALVAFAAALLTFRLTGLLAGRYRSSKRPELLAWAAGLGAYIAEATEKGDQPRVLLGIAVMAAFVVVFNRIVWGPLFRLSERRFRLS